MHTLLITAPPGMPPEDDDSPDGGGPPKRSVPLAAIDRILARNAALAEARILAHSWASISGEQKYVVENGGYYHLADEDDKAIYHQADIDAGRARIAWTAVPITPATLPPDVAFAPAGWD